jgi:hypothetical protein
MDNTKRMQTFSTALQSYFDHNVWVIQLIIAITIATILLWFYRNLGKEGRDDASARESLPEIEAALRRVLESTSINTKTAKDAALLIEDDEVKAPATSGAAKPATPAMPAAGAAAPTAAAPAATPAKPVLTTLGSTPAATTIAPAAAPVGAPAAGNSDELNKLKTDLDTKAKKIAEIEAAHMAAQTELTKAKATPAAVAPAADGAAPAGGPSGVDIAELNKKIKDLEARLSEYEIIEDDIANLSIYKEENARLKNELGKLKNGASPAAPTAPTVGAAPTPAAPAPAAPAPTPAPAAEEGHNPVKNVDSDKLLAEFQEMAAAPKTEPAAAPAGEVKPAEGKEVGEKLIAEFENFMKGGG